MFGAEETGVETTEIAFLSEIQYMNFLNSMDVHEEFSQFNGRRH